GDVGNIVLRDRRNLARDGMVIVVVAIDKNNFEIVSGPDVITRGFIYVRESEALINEIKNLSRNKLDECLKNQIIEWQVLKSGVKKSVEQLLYDKTKRRPSVFPIIMEV
ncbi:MAG: ribonuclease J, partial [Erysipelotrichaceae bacterium]